MLTAYLEGLFMKNLTLILTAIILSAGIACAFPETSSFNNHEMQQIQNLQRFKQGSYNEFKDFKQQQKENQERIKRDIERQKRLEQRAEQTNTNAKFINDTGVIKIENQY